MDINTIIKNKKYLKDEWRLSNEILYRMCIDYPSNIDPQSIIAKSLLIGRTYAVALERRKPLNDRKEAIPSAGIENDRFYKEYVVKRFKEIDIDKDLKEIKGWGVNDPLDLDDDQLSKVLELHLRLSLVIEGGTVKRSFASKYLHFHLPGVFFICDSRARTALKFLMGKHIKKEATHKSIANCDIEYKNFFFNCRSVFRWLKKDLKINNLTIRQFDNLLMAVFDATQNERNDTKPI